MSLDHDGFDFQQPKHQPVTRRGIREPKLAVGSFFGTFGEAHITGSVGGVDLECEITLDGYNDLTSLENAITAIEGQANELTGDLTENIAGDIRVWFDTTFLGIELKGMPFHDGSGVNKWVQFAILRWRQRT